MTKTVEQVRSEYIARSQKAKLEREYNAILSSCSPLEQEIVKTLSSLDHQSGGNLMRLVSIYFSIKEKSNKL